MSVKSQGVISDISSILKEIYAADVVDLAPESGTFAMEAVTRQIPDNSV